MVEQHNALVPQPPSDPFAMLTYLLFLPLQILGEVLRNLSAGTQLQSPHSPNSLRIIESAGQSAGPQSQSPPLVTYKNEESWDIKWSEEGLPTQIVIHRTAKRLD